MQFGKRWRTFTAGLLACLPTRAQAAGPYVVDDAAIGDPGECHVEAWISVAGNGDLIAVVQPACVVRLGIPVELTTTLQPVRIEGDWAALKGLQINFIVLPYGAGIIAIAVAVGTLVDTDNGESLTFVNAPLTLKIGDNLRLNVNGGWSFNSTIDTSHLTWGTSVEWDFVRSWTVIAEV